MKIGLLGIAHLSLNHGAAFAAKGFKVVFFDFDTGLVKQMEEENLDYSETGLKEALKLYDKNIAVTSKETDLYSCDLLYIARDVPTDDQGKSDLKDTHKLFEIARSNASSRSSVVILCQVPPGFTRQLDFPKDRLFYHMDPLIFGQALDRATKPDRFIIGLDNPERALTSSLERLLTSFECPILRMRYESAEFTKIAINLFLISSVSTTNTIADICEKIGADWVEMKRAVQLDKRIGPYAYTSPGLGLSGGNLERSLTSAHELTYAHGAAHTMVQAWMDDCTYRKDWVLKTLHQKVFLRNTAPKIGILGLAYKIDTNSIKNSPAFHLLEHLQSYDVMAFDPVVTQTPYAAVKIAHKATDILERDVVLIMTPWKEFKDLDYKKYKKIKVLIDPFNLFEKESKHLTCQYYALGKSI